MRSWDGLLTLKFDQEDEGQYINHIKRNKIPLVKDQDNYDHLIKQIKPMVQNFINF